MKNDIQIFQMDSQGEKSLSPINFCNIFENPLLRIGDLIRSSIFQSWPWYLSSTWLMIRSWGYFFFIFKFFFYLIYIYLIVMSFWVQIIDLIDDHFITHAVHRLSDTIDLSRGLINIKSISIPLIRSDCSLVENLYCKEFSCIHQETKNKR